MQVNVEEVSDLTKKLVVTLPADMVGARLDAAYNKLKNEVRIKGFRRGRVPRPVLEKTFRPQVEAEVAEELVKETYFDALEQTDLDPVVHPQVEVHRFQDDGTFLYEAKVDVRPEFELTDYTDITVQMEEIAVSDEEIEERLEAMRRQMAPLQSVTDRPVADGDLVLIDFEAFDEDGKPIEQVRGTDFSVEVGSGRHGEEFESALIGIEKGVETERTITFPPGFANQVLAGKTVTFKITVKDIKERVLPELDDEFAADVDEKFTSLDELREHIRAEILKEKEESQAGDLADKIMAELLARHDFPVPERLVVYEAEMMVKQMEQRLLAQGVSIEAAGLDRDQLAANYREPAEKRVRGDFILKKIAEKENIKLSEEDIEEGFQRVARQYDMTVAEVKQYFRAREDALPFMHELLNEKILDFLREKVTIERVPAGSETAAPVGQQEGTSETTSSEEADS